MREKPTLTPFRAAIPFLGGLTFSSSVAASFVRPSRSAKKNSGHYICVCVCLHRAAAAAMYNANLFYRACDQSKKKKEFAAQTGGGTVVVVGGVGSSNT